MATDEKGKKVEDPEDAEVNAYMDAESSNGEVPSDDDRKKYMQMRYEQIKNEYKSLRLQKEEADGRKNEEVLNRLTSAFRENFKARKYIVTELRKQGEGVKDQFIPKSVI